MGHRLMVTAALVAVVIALAVSMLAIERLATNRVWTTRLALVGALTSLFVAAAIALVILELG